MTNLSATMRAIVAPIPADRRRWSVSSAHSRNRELAKS